MTAADNVAIGDKLAGIVLNAIRHPVIMLDESGHISYANADAEAFSVPVPAF